MRSVNARRARGLNKAVAGIAVGIVAASSAQIARADLYWDGDGLGAASGGSGQWDNTLLRWATTPGGTTYTNFVNGEKAVFGGTGGTINLLSTGAAPLSGSIDVRSNGYIFEGTSAIPNPFTPIYNWGGAATVNVAAGVLTDIKMATGGLTLTKTGAGTLRWGSGLTTDGGTVNLQEGTLLYGRTNLVSSLGSPVALAPNVNSITQINMSAGTTLDLSTGYNDAVGGLNGSGTVILGVQHYSPDLVTSGPSYTYGSTFIINGGNAASTTGTATITSNFSGNIVSAGPADPNLPLSGGHLVIGPQVTIVSPAGLQAEVTLSGNNTFHGPTTINPGATLYLAGGHALPDAQPIFLTANNWLAPVVELRADEAVGSIGANGGGAAGLGTVLAYVNLAGHTLTIGGDNLNNDFAAMGGFGNFNASDLGGMVVKVGTGTQLVSTSASFYTGKYTIKNGAMVFKANVSTGAAPGGPVSDYFLLDGGTLGHGLVFNPARSLWDANKGITVTDNGGGITGWNIPLATSMWDIAAPITSGGVGTGSLTKSGVSWTRLYGGDNSGFKGGWKITDGVLGVGNGYGSTVGLGDKVAGTGSIDIAGANLVVSSDYIATDANQSMNLASAVGAKVTFGPGATLILDKGNDGAVAPATPSYNNSLTVNIGNAGATNGAAFVRKDRGSLLVLASSGAGLLGTPTGEIVKVNGGITSTPVNGGANSVVPGVLISTSDVVVLPTVPPADPVDPRIAATASNSEGFFAAYDATAGLKTATMSAKTDINTANNTDLYAAVSTSTNVLSANASAYGVKIGAAAVGADLDLAGKTLNVGGAIANEPAVVIIGQGSNIKGGGTLAFGSHEGILYAELPGGSTPPAVQTVTATITGSNGLTKMGYGQLSLDATTQLNYTGQTTIEQGMLTLNATNQLPVTTDLVLAGVNATNNFGRAPTLNVNNQLVTVNSLNSANGKLYNGAANGATIYLGTTGTLKITGSGDSFFNGLITSVASNSATSIAAGNTSTVWVAGPGTLHLGLGSKMVNNETMETFNTYAKLWVTDGGTVEASSVATFGGTGTVLPPALAGVADTIKLDGGTLRFVGGGGSGYVGGIYGSSTSAIPLIDVINANRGITIGANGGTIDVQNPYVQISLGGANAVFAGTGTLTKTGPGMLAIPNSTVLTTPNKTDQHWKLVVKQGFVVLTGGANPNVDDFLGAAPATLVPDAYTLDGGSIDANSAGTVTIAATNGFYIGPNGGSIGTGRSALSFNGPFSGPGDLVIGGSTPVNDTVFAASGDGTVAPTAFTGKVTLARSGRVFANAKNALGIGTITNDPAWPVFFGTSAGTAAAPIQLDNKIVAVEGESFDFITRGANTYLKLNGQISGDAALYKGYNSASASDGTLELANATNNFTGPFSVGQGILIPSVNGALSTTASPLNVNGTGVLAFKGGVNYSSPKPVFVGGTVGAGSIRNISEDNTFAGPITLTSGTTFGSAAGTLTLTGGVSGAADSPVTKVGAGKVVLGGTLSYKGNTAVNAGTLAFASGLTSSGSLTVADGATAQVTADGAAKLLTVASLNLNATGTLDLTDNNLAVTYTAGNGPTTLAAIVASIKQAYDFGKWDLTGITSSLIRDNHNLGTALAYADDAANSRAVVKYTWLGDANLDGKVNQTDVALVNAAGTTWGGGDFNYDGKVSSDDYALMALGAAMQDGSIGAAVPEPASLVLAPMGAALLGLRRRRTR